MQIHFKKFNLGEYSLMVYDGDLYDFIEKTLPDASEETIDHIMSFSAHLLNELGIYLTPSEEIK